MKTKKQIIEWLKYQGLYEAFAKNIHPVTVEEIAEQYIREVHCSLSIFTSFSWHNTDEGFDFWAIANRNFMQWFNSDEQTEQPSKDKQSESSSDRWIFDRGSKEAPFYMAYAEGKTAPTFKHGSMEEATKEADRLAKLLNTKTYVLAAVMEIRPEIVTSAVGIDDMEHQVDNPF